MHGLREEVGTGREMAMVQGSAHKVDVSVSLKKDLKDLVNRF
jgi:hypothetical protein